jgi:hypothetical protein
MLGPEMTGEVSPSHSCRKNLTLEFMPKSELGEGWVGGFRRWKTEPFGTVYSHFTEGAQEHVESRFSSYDPDGNCCRGSCIGYLQISAHGGPGSIDFGPGHIHYNAKTIEDFDKYKNRPIPPNSRELGKYIRDYLKEDALLRTLASKLCRNATVVFVVCNLGAGPEGAGMKEIMKNIFPAGTDHKFSEDRVGFNHGEPWIIGPNDKPIAPWNL